MTKIKERENEKSTRARKEEESYIRGGRGAGEESNRVHSVLKLCAIDAFI